MNNENYLHAKLSLYFRFGLFSFRFLHVFFAFFYSFIFFLESIWELVWEDRLPAAVLKYKAPVPPCIDWSVPAVSTEEGKPYELHRRTD